MNEKIKNYQQKGFELVRRVSDVRFVGLLLFVVIVLLISWSGVKIIQTNYGLQKKISLVQQQNEVQQLDNNNLALQNKYLNTRQYLELAARANFGLAAPGETELIVPESVALAHTVEASHAPSNTPQAQATQPAYEANFRAWMNFFLHRQAAQ